MEVIEEIEGAMVETRSVTIVSVSWHLQVGAKSFHLVC